MHSETYTRIQLLQWARIREYRSQRWSMPSRSFRLCMKMRVFIVEKDWVGETRSAMDDDVVCSGSILIDIFVYTSSAGTGMPTTAHNSIVTYGCPFSRFRAAKPSTLMSGL